MDAFALEIGDVLLVRDPDFTASVICEAAGGRFSHAALYIGSYLLFEAQPNGLVYSPLKIIKAETQPNNWVRVLCSMAEYRDFAIYRCPRAFQKDPDEELWDRAGRLSKILINYVGLEYPKLERLADAAPVLDRTPELKRLILRIIGRVRAGDSSKTIPGLFCSELVIAVLTTLGFDVLKIPCLDSARISPADLADPDISNLVEVQGVTAPMNDALPNDPELLERARGLASLADNLNKFNVVRKSSKEINMFLEEQAKNVHREIVAQRKRKNKASTVKGGLN